MTAAPPILVFDVNETLIDIESIAPVFERILGDPASMREWFNQLVMYSMTATLSGHYVDFFTLGQGVLRMLATTRSVEIAEADVAALKHAMLTAGRPILFATLINTSGFLALTLSDLPPMRQFGVVSASAFVLALIADFTALPGALWILSRRTRECL